MKLIIHKDSDDVCIVTHYNGLNQHFKFNVFEERYYEIVLKIAQILAFVLNEHNEKYEVILEKHYV